MRRLTLLMTIITALPVLTPAAYGQIRPFQQLRRPLPPPTRTPIAEGNNWNPFFNPEVPTYWHRLGVPQTFGQLRNYRDSRINRDGLSPEKERTPQLKKLTDPANLEAPLPGMEPSAMLSTAAELKMDQDMAPQKLKALRYICSLGCSCKNQKVQEKIAAALQEGTTWSRGVPQGARCK